jgi:23S rRNA pseudouridine1911/1915/1917 synthase
MNSDDKTVSIGADELAAHAGRRLDAFLAERLGRSRMHAQSLLKRGLVKLDPHPEKVRASHRLRAGDSLTIAEAPEEPSEGAPVGEAIPLRILFEDDWLLALDKPPGIVVHPSAGHRTGTIVNALVHHLGGHLAQRGGMNRPGLVHRLDKDTSGVLIIAKSDAAHEQLARAFAQREARKVYRALCWGKFRRLSGECREAIGRHPIHRQKMAVAKAEGRGRASWTDYRVRQAGAQGTEVECVLHTGRTHQIRVHLAHLGHPVWGDLVYGRAHPLKDGFTPARQMLHAELLEIAHPQTDKLLRLEAKLPDDFVEARRRILE